tara:strand:+ start:198 stop:446 length:249 start_codon:yes stop_codon:yes gene_type:complete
MIWIQFKCPVLPDRIPNALANTMLEHGRNVIIADDPNGGTTCESALIHRALNGGKPLVQGHKDVLPWQVKTGFNTMDRDNAD